MGTQGWVLGVITQRNLINKTNGSIAPYQIKLDDGSFCVAQNDERMVKAAPKGTGPPPPPAPLKFTVGDRVMANMGQKGWMKGTITLLNCVDPNTGRPVPYEVRLDDGMAVYAPMDSPTVVQPAKGFVAPKMKKLRFGVGDRVLANMGPEGWRPGVVKEVNARSPVGKLCPYHIALDNGNNAYAPVDESKVVRAE